MRIYTEEEEEALRARGLAREWAGEGLISEAQRERLEEETPCELRTTNVFLRVVLFVFTALIVVAAFGLVAVVVKPSSGALSLLCVFLSVASYWCAEAVASEGKFYRHGVEEALAVCSVALLCAAAMLAMDRTSWHEVEPLVCGVGALGSLWVWWRFGLAYCFAAAMLFAFFVPEYWSGYAAVQRVVVAAGYGAALWVMRGRRRAGGGRLEEAMLWLGIYLVMNLRIGVLDVPGIWYGGRGEGVENEFGRVFYWATWVVIWCLPLVILRRGIRLKDRYVIAAGAVAMVLTLVCNKPYLGWVRHTWDPMLLGVLLVCGALWLRRWLGAGPGGVREGFTAARLSGKDDRWMRVGGTLGGFISPHGGAADAPPEALGRGGASGGGGASREF